jgi:hypothetical protein
VCPAAATACALSALGLSWIGNARVAAVARLGHTLPATARLPTRPSCVDSGGGWVRALWGVSHGVLADTHLESLGVRTHLEERVQRCGQLHLQRLRLHLAVVTVVVVRLQLLLLQLLQHTRQPLHRWASPGGFAPGVRGERVWGWQRGVACESGVGCGGGSGCAGSVCGGLAALGPRVTRHDARTSRWHARHSLAAACSLHSTAFHHSHFGFDTPHSTAAQLSSHNSRYTCISGRMGMPAPQLDQVSYVRGS